MTKLDIINAALALLGSDVVIVDLETDDSAEAQLARQIYPLTYEAEVSDFRWSWARSEAATLARLVDLTADYKPRYALPVDYLALTYVRGEVASKLTYRIDEGPVLVILDAVGESESITVGYIRKVGEAQSFALFGNALSQIMAGKMAPTITGSTTVAQFWLEEGKDAMKRAREADQRSQGPSSIAAETEYSLLSCRRG